ncbi:AEC family transporter [Neoroseomonas soli]|uniref:AEC family transporter n=1 Tax=Neoroseomonas soli TaxID=1081025 RepID=A0A9X9WYU8_9PROT|nr:AEC family transporter [Neoroseomonas soli]MBR0672327.1 AEC family transporter [Neoroseomonas soli]
MGAILGIVAPVFAIVGLGYLAAARRLIDEAGFRGLNSFAFNLAAPALLFAGGTAGHAGGGPAAFAFFAAAVVLYGVALWLGTRRMEMPLGEAGLFALNCTFGNTVMMGIPLIAASFGQAGLSILITIIALHSMVLLTLGTVVAEFGLHRHAPWRRIVGATLAGIARNPVVVTVFVALGWSTIGLPVPGPMRRTLEMLGAATPAVALFCLGGSLAVFSTGQSWREVAWATVLKLAALPLMVWGGCVLLALSPLETGVAVMTAALPTGANAFLLARRYATGADRSGATVLVSTVISVFTLAAVLAWVQG